MTEKQCADYSKVSSKNNASVIKWYKFCQEVCTDWFGIRITLQNLEDTENLLKWMRVFSQEIQNITKVDSLVEMHDDEKWLFGMTERGRLDAVAIQVPSNRSSRALFPHIVKHCLPGTIFCTMHGGPIISKKILIWTFENFTLVIFYSIDTAKREILVCSCVC